MVYLIAAILAASMSERLLATPQTFVFGHIRFEENRGQTSPEVQYLARARGQQVFLTDSAIVLSPNAGPAVRMSFAGAGKARWLPSGPASESISYYIGNDPAKWVKNSPVFDRVVWRNVYRGIDVVLYGRGDRLEYDLVLAPEADPSQVRLRFSGAEQVRSGSTGVIELVSGDAIVRQNAPEIYQENSSGNRVRVAGSFVPAGFREFRLELGDYERSKTLIVDPVIEAASYLGGENEDEITAVNEWAVGGNTRSVGFPQAGVALRRSRDIFVRGTGARLQTATSRTAFTHTTVIGGSGDDELAAMAITSSVIVTLTLAGTTRSADFPAMGGSRYLGGVSDGFLVGVGINPGPALLFARLVGGSGEDRIESFAATGTVQALAGSTDSPDLPATETKPGGGRDAFCAVGASNSPNLQYSYLGGSGEDTAYAVAVRSRGFPIKVWVGGETQSPDFPFPSLNCAARPTRSSPKHHSHLHRLWRRRSRCIGWAAVGWTAYVRWTPDMGQMSWGCA